MDKPFTTSPLKPWLTFANSPEFSRSFETGLIGRQANAALMLKSGDSTVYSTACRDRSPKSGLDFIPLSVDYQERFSAAGMTSGAYNKRDGRPGEGEILVSRLIDRPLRPLIDSKWRHETQLLSWVLSYDGKKSTNAMAICAASAALYLSDVPIDKPVAGVEIGLIDDAFVVNPSNEQMAKSDLKLTVAGTESAVLMIEGAANFLTEEQVSENRKGPKIINLLELLAITLAPLRSFPRSTSHSSPSLPFPPHPR